MKPKILGNFNWGLCWGTLVMITIGLVNLYSAVRVWGEGDMEFLFWNQVLWLVIGLILMSFFILFDYRLWEKLAIFFYGFSILLLVLVLFVGREISGHTSWFSVGGISLQPSEFAKIGLILMLARFFNNSPRPLGYGFFSLLQPIGWTLLPFALVLLQKDLGSSLFFPLIFVTVLFVAKIKKSTVAIFLCLMAVGGSLAYQYALKPYQKERLKIFLNPESDPRRSGYHLIQSKIAVGSGRFLGKGYLKGRINKLKYLPDKHTDFIFPVLAEEWGFLGSILTLGLFAYLLWEGIGIAIKAREPLGAFIATGVTALLFWHFIINLGGVLGVLPLTGVPLPFFSYGGSSTMGFLLGVGLLFNIHMRRFMF